MNRIQKSEQLIARLREIGGSCDVNAAADAMEAMLRRERANWYLAELVTVATRLAETANYARQYDLDATGPLGSADERETYRGELEQRMAAVRAAMIQCCEAGVTDKAAVHSRADKILARRALPTTPEGR